MWGIMLTKTELALDATSYQMVNRYQCFGVNICLNVQILYLLRP